MLQSKISVLFFCLMDLYTQYKYPSMTRRRKRTMMTMYQLLLQLTKVCAKGFAFVWMLSKKDAERAIEGCNGMTVCAGTAETLGSDKQKKKKLKRIEKKLKESADAGKKTADEEEADRVDEDEDMEKEEPTNDK